MILTFMCINQKVSDSTKAYFLGNQLTAKTSLEILHSGSV